METEEDRRRWRAALKKMGASNVTLWLARVEINPDVEVRLIGDVPPWPNRRVVQQWLLEEEAAPTRLANRLLSILPVGLRFASATSV
jgi:hypothetical protein